MSHYLITGASAGIGSALAKKLAEKQHRVSGIARRKARLMTLQQQNKNFKGYQADVCKADAIDRVVAASIKKFGSIDVAILNAGIYIPQDGSLISPSVYAEHMNINYMGVINTLASIVPKMITTGHGHIVIISSVAGWRGLPKAAAYGPTKAALISLAESLYFDLTPKNIKIQVICPGFVDTEATAVNDFKMPDLLSAEAAATHIISAMKKPYFSVSFPLSFSRKIKFLKYLPYPLYFSLVGKHTGSM